MHLLKGLENVLDHVVTHGQLREDVQVGRDLERGVLLVLLHFLDFVFEFLLLLVRHVLLLVGGAQRIDHLRLQFEQLVEFLFRIGDGFLHLVELFDGFLGAPLVE